MNEDIKILVVGNTHPSGKGMNGVVVDPKGLAYTITTNKGEGQKIVEETKEMYRIRKLTPSECFKLMGFDYADADKLSEAGISNTQLYKMAGNSIVVPCLEFIFKEIYRDEEKENQ